MTLASIRDFLLCETPPAWLEAVPSRLAELLIDHANCEKKAAGTALNLIYKYVDHPELLQRLSKLAREELRHFEQVHRLMRDRDIDYRHLSSARYAGALRNEVRQGEPERLVDILVVGAIVEARSCERFACVARLLRERSLDLELAAYYERLLDSEARHFEVYLALAEQAQGGAVDDRVAAMLRVEQKLIEMPDSEFRFHSGPPTASSVG